MNIKITEEQLKKIVNTNEDYGIPDEYQDSEKVLVTIITPNGKLNLGEIRNSLLRELKKVIHSMNLMDDTHIFIEEN